MPYLFFPLMGFSAAGMHITVQFQLCLIHFQIIFTLLCSNITALKICWAIFAKFQNRSASFISASIMRAEIFFHT